MPDLRLGDKIVAMLAKLERDHGQARLLTGDDRERVCEELGLYRESVVFDIGTGPLGSGPFATAGPRGGDLKIHR